MRPELQLDGGAICPFDASAGADDPVLVHQVLRVVFFSYVRLRTVTGGLNVNSHCGTDNKVIIIPYVTEGVIVITTWHVLINVSRIWRMCRRKVSVTGIHC